MILVVEPHADDAFLSVGQHIEDWVRDGREVRIWTVFSGTRKRASDAQAYACSVGAHWMGSNLVEGEPIGVDLRFQIPADTSEMVLPIALTHPEHVAVREALEGFLVAPLRYYLDQPYAIIQKHSELVTERLRGMEVVSYRKPGKRKYRHIPLFRDQVKFFHYNPAEKLLQTCELIVRRPSL